MEERIKLKIIEGGDVTNVNTYEGEYNNLMSLIRDNLILDDFGQCGGMGRCATCIVSAKGVFGISQQKERNEPSTLLKYGLLESDARLSCQLSITTDLDGAEFTVLEV